MLERSSTSANTVDRRRTEVGETLAQLRAGRADYDLVPLGNTR